MLRVLVVLAATLWPVSAHSELIVGSSGIGQPSIVFIESYNNTIIEIIGDSVMMDGRLVVQDSSFVAALAKVFSNRTDPKPQPTARLEASEVPDDSLWDGICPECKKLGQKSTVYQGVAYSTLLASTAHYDESGKYHYNDPNTTTICYECSKGHGFSTANGRLKQ